MRPFLLAVLFASAFLPCAAASAQTPRDGIVLSTSAATFMPVHSGGAQRIAYEIQLTNFANMPLNIERLDVLDAADPAKPLASWSGAALQSMIALAGAGRDDKPTRTLTPGRHGIVYVDLLLPAQTPMPRTLRHRVTFDRNDDTTTTSVEGAQLGLAASAAVVLGPPLRDGNWVALYDPAMARGHRRVAFAIDGGLRIPARFAIDWMRIDEKGRLMHGDEEQLDHWLGYGADVIAAADATVVALRDSIAEPARLADATHHPLEDASGNYVSLDLGEGRYLHYEHLKPGSVRVHVGDHMHRGDPIARLGFTGDATGPHLHMHVSDGATPLAGEGLPFVFDVFEQRGRYASMQAFGAGGHWVDATADQRVRRAEMPEAQAVLEFRRPR